MKTNLGIAVDRYIREVKTSPASSVGTALDELENASAQQTFDGSFWVPAAPVASHTWQLRSVLSCTATESDPDETELGYAIEILGMQPTLLAVGRNGKRPPMEAIDVSLRLNRRETFTHQVSKRANQNTSREVVNLPLLQASLPRLLAIRAAEGSPVLSVQFRWAVPLDIVTARGWDDTQITLGFFVRPLDHGPEANGGCRRC